VASWVSPAQLASQWVLPVFAVAGPLVEWIGASALVLHPARAWHWPSAAVALAWAEVVQSPIAQELDAVFVPSTVLVWQPVASHAAEAVFLPDPTVVEHPEMPVNPVHSWY
jgi:hypothetical protein